MNKKHQAEKRFKEKEIEKQIQHKITETWKRIPEHEKIHLLKEDEKKKRLELREIKVNVWKKWRKESKEKRKEVEEKQKRQQERWLETLEETLTRLKREVDKRKRSKIIYEERREKLRKTRKNRNNY